eukprot:361217-Chlamydomonas_euryale.AAC.8
MNDGFQGWMPAMDVWMYGWMDGWMDGWLDGYLDNYILYKRGWMDRLTQSLAGWTRLNKCAF